MRTSRSRQRHGFTLVEMLVVIAIIGVLTAILVPTVASAVRRAREGATVLELKDLEAAIIAYKDANNDYPPDGTDLNAVTAHLRIAYQRIPNHAGYTSAWWGTGNLDPDLSREVFRVFRQINSTGTTVLAATHSPELITEFGGRVLVLDRGRLVGDQRLAGRHGPDYLQLVREAPPVVAGRGGP